MMNQEDIFKKVGQILNELQDQYEFLAQNPKQLNELELELFLANANFLSDHVQIVRKINSSKAIKTIPEVTESAIEEVNEVVSPLNQKETLIPQATIIRDDEPAIQEAEEIAEEAHEPLKFEFLLSETPESDKFDFEEQPLDAIFDRPLSDEEQQIIARKQQQLHNNFEEESPRLPVPEAERELFPAAEHTTVEQPPISDAPKPTLNDLLAGKSSQTGSVNEPGNKPAITDLKQAINLNEKLLYIKDLFNGYNLAYAEAIELINKMPDFKTADAFLKNNYAVKNNWAAKQNTVDQFYELLNQRFPVK